MKRLGEAIRLFPSSLRDLEIDLSDNKLGSNLNDFKYLGIGIQ